ncbi:MAG: cytochrome c family protein [Planctomycetes bacterium]|nr:cytochrome c family protein [Planctomycetota bacterium]
MILNFRTILIAVVVATAGVVWFALQPWSRGDVRVPVSTASVGTPLPKGIAIGNTGCLSAACHGGHAAEALAGKFDANTWQGSGTCWNARDPHMRAYSLLTDKPMRPVRATAAHIMKGLHSEIPATEDVRCLACHSNPSLASSGKADPHVIALRSEGVGCESCHGNATGWLREHTTWKSDNHAEYASTGMTPLFDIGDRAMTCVGCHIGAPADPARGYAVRDMNHDMIAAGHPRLDFDFAEFHRELPKHWQEKERTPTGSKPRTPMFEARKWVVGRVAQAEGACKLLADRAERAKAQDPRTPWPELAEFNCASCHHDLPQPWRSEPPTLGTRPLGSLRWQTIWPLTDSINDQGAFGEIAPVLTVMQKKRPAGYAEVVPIANQVANKLAENRRKISSTSGNEAVPLSPGLVLMFGGAAPLSEFPEWDRAGQMLQGLAALQRAHMVNGPPDEFTQAFDAVRRRDWNVARPTINALLPDVRGFRIP